MNIEKKISVFKYLENLTVIYHATLISKDIYPFLCKVLEQHKMRTALLEHRELKSHLTLFRTRHNKDEKFSFLADLKFLFYSVNPMGLYSVQR